MTGESTNLSINKNHGRRTIQKHFDYKRNLVSKYIFRKVFPCLYTEYMNITNVIGLPTQIISEKIFRHSV